MARNLNRTIIESSLEMKVMLFFGVALAIVIAVSFWLYWRVTQALVREQNPLLGSVWASQYLQERHVGVFGRPTSDDPTSSDEYKKQVEGIMKRIRNRDFVASFIPYPNNSDYLDNSPEHLAKVQEERKKYSAILDRFLPKVQPDFQSNRGPRSEDMEDGDTYHYFEEVRIDKQIDRAGNVCYQCHRTDEQGELLGVIHVVIPESTMRKTQQKYWAYMLAAAIVSMFLSLVAVNIVIRWIVIKPLRNLRDVSESISRGEIAKRAEIQTGDEFEVLAEAYNRMLRHLVNSQELLRNANNELESKVDELAHLTIRLYETNQVKSDFMATMSHELRTPLNSILGFSDVLGSISTLNEKQKRYVDNISKSGKSLLTMINDILDMAKMEAGRVDIQTMTFNIAAIVAAQVDMAKPLVDRKNINLETIIEPDLPTMKQDESRIQQILNNLLSNAIKFTPEGGWIRVSVQRLPAVPLPAPATPPPIAGAAVKTPRNRDMLEIKVADNGVGISEEDQLIIFEKFRQGKCTMTEGDAMKREHSGSGLGLSIVKEICKMLEGEISVESHLGSGSTFCVRLPWTLEPKAKIGSEMMAGIQQFAQNRVSSKR